MSKITLHSISVDSNTENIENSLIVPTTKVFYAHKATQDTYGVVKLKQIDDKITAHNESPEAHSDIRELVSTNTSEIERVEEKVDTNKSDIDDLKIKTTDLENNKVDKTTEDVSVIKTIDMEFPYGVFISSSTKEPINRPFNTSGRLYVGAGGVFMDLTADKNNSLAAIAVDENGVSINGSPAINKEALDAELLNVDNKISNLKILAAYTFTTRAEFLNWLSGTYVREDGALPEDLNIGDDIFIVEEGTPDYWVKSKSVPMTEDNFAAYESGDYKPKVVWLQEMLQSSLFKGVTYLSQTQYETLLKYGVVEVDGTAITYDDSMLYVTPVENPDRYYTKEEIDDKLNECITVSNQTDEMDNSVVLTYENGVLSANLNDEITSTISKALKSPMSTPAATEIVAVDDTNTQTMLGIGEGLSVEDGVLKAAASGGNKLYEHNIQCTIYTRSLTIKLINNIDTPFNLQGLKDYLTANGWTGTSISNANGYPLHIMNFTDTASNFVIFNKLWYDTKYDEISLSRTTRILSAQLNPDDNSIVFSAKASVGAADITSFSDTVIEL